MNAKLLQCARTIFLLILAVVVFFGKQSFVRAEAEFCGSGGVCKDSCGSSEKEDAAHNGECFPSPKCCVYKDPDEDLLGCAGTCLDVCPYGQITYETGTTCQQSGRVCCVDPSGGGGSDDDGGNGNEDNGGGGGEWDWDGDGYRSAEDLASEMNLPQSTLTDILLNIFNWILGMIGILGVFGFLVSGAQFLLSAGNKTMIDRAKAGALWSAVGVAVALSGLVILTIVQNLLEAEEKF